MTKSGLRHRKPSRNSGEYNENESGGRCRSDLAKKNPKMHVKVGKKNGMGGLISNSSREESRLKNSLNHSKEVQREVRHSKGLSNTVRHMLGCVPYRPFFTVNRVFAFMCIVWIMVHVEFHRDASFAGERLLAGEGEHDGHDVTDRNHQRIHWMMPEEMTKLIEISSLKRRAAKSYDNEVESGLKKKRPSKKNHEKRPYVEPSSPDPILMVDDPPDGCDWATWQKQSYPNCNVLHEIELLESMTKKRNNKETSSAKSGYIGKGYWRNVWRIEDPRDSMRTGVVKLMRMHHPVIFINFERHRKEALTMDQLTSNPYIVNAYGFCGNTVFTEYVGRTLDEVLYSNKTRDDGVTRNTPEGRIRIALDVSRGLEAMHLIPGGGVVHADIQTQQFLVDSSGRVRINDYNRCRFIAHNKVTGEMCKFKLPVAPGTLRAPEEYKFTDVTEKLDVFSLGHVFYGILTGSLIFRGYNRNQKMLNTLRKMVVKGSLPRLDDFAGVKERDEVALVDVMSRAYELDPNRRASASELVTLLESVLAELENSA